ncbi:MAG: hypothetical protein KIT79_12730 [Deltaproteobacteria bacterium]|nr:hypothetical protein [Deltaproteobacteria bacterium]
MKALRIAGPSEAAARLRCLGGDAGSVRAVAFFAGTGTAKAAFVSAWSAVAREGDRLICWPRRLLTLEDIARKVVRLRLCGMTAALVEVRPSDIPEGLNVLIETAATRELPLILMDRDPGPLFAVHHSGGATA